MPISLLCKTNYYFDMDDSLLTVEEASKILDCHPDWVRKLCKRGLINCKRFGRSWAVDRASLERYKEQEHKPGPKPKKTSPTSE